MFGLKNRWQIVNKILITVFVLMVSYMCVWPWTQTSPSHAFDDQSYRRFGGVLAQPVEIYNNLLEEETTLDAGTAVIYEFDDSGNPVVIHTWDDKYTPDEGGIIDHSYNRVTVSVETFADQDEVNRNYQEYLQVSKERAEARLNAVKMFKYRFVPSQLVIAIPVGAVLWFLLNALENKHERKRVFTVLFVVFLIIFSYVYFIFWVDIGTLCR